MIHGLLLAASLSITPARPASPIAWQPALTAAVFDKARAEHRFVLLDLHAVWCHWCHVMDGTTYKDPKVRRLLAQKYIAVQVDQDADPSLSLRYERWGWPATVVFAADGTELVKRRGYLAPDVMESLLQAIIDDPTPGPSVVAEAELPSTSTVALSPEARKKLEQRFDGIYDEVHAGWGGVHRLIDAEILTYAFARKEHGDAQQGDRAHRTLTAGLRLMDPAAGGMYQYSDTLDWSSPHYEKLTSVQAQALGVYALGAALWPEDVALKKGAEALHRYLRDTLRSPQGTFYASQDADLDAKTDGKAFHQFSAAEQKVHGQPRVDTHVYARENGWVIAALCQYADATGDVSALTEAKQAAEVMLRTRKRIDALFWHLAPDETPVLADSLAMAQAFHALYQSTGQRSWLQHESETVDAMDRVFPHPSGAGYVTALPRKDRAPGALQGAVRHPVQNAEWVRLTQRLSLATGEARFQKMAERAMRFVSALAVSDFDRASPLAWVADAELGHAPLHVTLVGRKDDAAAQALYDQARQTPRTFRLLEWLDRREGLPPHPAPPFPDLPKPALYLCTERSCSRPLFTAAQLKAAL